MADLSLDDFIKKNNVKVKINNSASQPAGRRPQQMKTQLMTRPLQKQVTKTFDARQKLAPKVTGDARSKITSIKKSGGGDARNKIVQKQVQKGTFDVRSLLQRKAVKGNGKNPGGANAKTGLKSQTAAAGGPLRRTLNNPSAKTKGQVLVTNTGLSITRPQAGNQVSLTGNSLQVTRRNQPPPPPSLSDAIPIIQIRNDRYKDPGPPPPFQPTMARPVAPVSQYSQHPSDYNPYGSFHYEEAPFKRPHGYRDLDDPQHNPQSIAVPDFPKIRVQNVKTVESPVMRPVSYSDSHPPPRAPPGAATLSLSSRQQAVPSKTMPIKVSPAGIKRRSAPEPISGPLRLGKGGGPGIDLDPSPIKRSRPSLPDEPEVIEVENEDADYISPLQGYRVVVTNLFNGVTQDDIIELFGAVGPLKKAKLLKSGSAEVVYVSKNDAISAVQKYHSRELDGQPMYVKMTTPVGALVKKARGEHDPDITGEALRLYKKPSGADAVPKPPIEVPTIHRALFKAGPPGPNKSVRFTVKI